MAWCWLTQALEQFSTDAADTENDPAKESIFDEKVQCMSWQWDTHLHWRLVVSVFVAADFIRQQQ